MNQNNQEDIIRKIKGLLAIANDHKNDTESQNSFLLAQKLMMKHKIQEHELNLEKEASNNVSYENIEKVQVTASKGKIQYWESLLALVFADNFPVKCITTTTYSKLTKKKAISFVGNKEDCYFARDLYTLAYETIILRGKRYVDNYYNENPFEERNRSNTTYLLNSYYVGFCKGLHSRFKAQSDSLKEEDPKGYELAIVTPTIIQNYVDEVLNSKKKHLTTTSKLHKQSVEEGKKDGKKTDLEAKRLEF